MSKVGTGVYFSVVLRVARFHRYVCGKPPLFSSADKRASPDMSFLAQALTVDPEGTKTPLTSHSVPRPNIRMHLKLQRSPITLHSSFIQGRAPRAAFTCRRGSAGPLFALRVRYNHPRFGVLLSGGFYRASSGKRQKPGHDHG